MTVDEVVSLHRRAMASADAATMAKLRRDRSSELAALRQAFEFEKAAAEAANQIGIEEPSRSVLLRSAATLAYDVGELGEAERLAHVAMAGYPPEFVKSELRGLLENVSASQHLRLEGVTLSPGEFQFMVHGPAVGHGFIPIDIFEGRVKTLEKTLFRTGERLLGRPFRPRGNRPTSVSSELPIMLSAPRAASFAITFRLGTGVVPLFVEGSLAAKVVSEVVLNLQRLDRGEEEAVAQAIPDLAYRRSFIASAKALAPDGRRITGVGLTLPPELGHEPYMLRRTPDELPDPPAPDEVVVSRSREGEVVIVRGSLLFADDRNHRGEIAVVPEDGGASVPVVVPEGLDDIVEVLWGKLVVVKGVARTTGVELVDIRLAD